MDRARLLAWSLALGGLSAAALAPLSVAVPTIVNRISDRWGYTPNVFLAAAALSSALVILIPATLMGCVFPLASRLLVSRVSSAAGRIGRAYIANAAGAVAGALLTGFLLLPVLGLKWSVLALAALQVITGIALLQKSSGPRWRSVPLGALAPAAAAAVMLGLRGPQPFDVGRVGPRPARAAGARRRAQPSRRHRREL